MTAGGHPQPEPRVCARCGNTAGGWAFIDKQRFCHDDTPGRSCYEQESWDRAFDDTASPRSAREWLTQTRKALKESSDGQ